MKTFQAKNGIVVALIIFLMPVQSFSAGSTYGVVVGWGGNTSGQVSGVPNGVYTNGAVVIDGEVVTNAVAVAAGASHGLALRSDGTVVEWGQIRDVPKGLSNVVTIAAGRRQSMALKDDGTAVSWSGGVSSLSTDALSIDGWHSSVVKKDGTVFIAGQTVPALSNVVAIAGYRNIYGQFVALKSDGTVLECNTIGSKSFVPVSNVVAIAAGRTHSLALKKDGTVFAWGSNPWGETNVPAGLSNVVAIAAGNGFSMALRKDGTVITWGFSLDHQLDVPVGLSNVVAIAAGEGFCLTVTTNKAVAERFMQKEK